MARKRTANSRATAAKKPKAKKPLAKKRVAGKPRKKPAPPPTPPAGAAPSPQTPTPFTYADPSKAPGKQHRHPPMSLRGVKHSQNYIAKARTSFKLRQTMGR